VGVQVKPPDTFRKVEKLRHVIHEQHRTIRNLREKVAQLQSRLNVKCYCSLSPLVAKIKKIESNSQSTKGAMLLEQINAFGKQRHRWSEFVIRQCIIWRAKSPCGYDMARRSSMFSLPSCTTLRKYTGPSSLTEGFSHLIEMRLKEEIKVLHPKEKFCTIMFDEMSIKPQGNFVRQVGRVIGRATLWNRSKFDSAPLANKLLCFVITGLSTHYRIPVAYYLTKDLDSGQQLETLKSIIRSVETIGFKIVRAVCDCISFNVKTFIGLCGGDLVYEIEHPCDPARRLFMSFDPCHILKNLRNQFIDKKRKWRNCGEPINGNPIREIYNLQKDRSSKPVRFLTRKMVFPTTFEKMNVSRAVRLFSIEMTAALTLLQEARTSGFENIEATVEFMSFVRKWFEVMGLLVHVLVVGC